MIPSAIEIGTTVRDRRLSSWFVRRTSENGKLIMIIVWVRPAVRRRSATLIESPLSTETVILLFYSQLILHIGSLQSIVANQLAPICFIVTFGPDIILRAQLDRETAAGCTYHITT